MKILIVKLSSIGDIVHTLPTLAAIRRALPNAEISWVAEKGSAEVLRHNQFLSHLIEVDTKALRRGKTLGEIMLTARQQLRGLRASAFDVSIDFQGLLKSAAIAKISKAKRRFGFSRQNLREPASRFLLTDAIRVEKNLDVIRRSLRLAEKALHIPVPDADFEFPIFTEGKHRAEAEAVIEKAGANFAVLNPAGNWATKLWHAEKFGALADRLWEENDLPSVVTTAPNERHLAEKVLLASKSGKVFAVQPSLKGFYELARHARVYVGGDTAPTHLAVAARAPVVGIFGPTEWWRNGSPNADDVGVERTDIGCRIECNRRTCSNWICMDIEVETVLRAVQMRLKTAENRA
ncbi:MAG TPA: lipopolysaccharide heptosyltransferase I [Pyrinomonadaceae bacterium]|jgi:lipopolysaccharide heptosyltransferase I